MLNKELILSIPKTIDNNQCWIPNNIPYTNGYVHVIIDGTRYALHRLSMCIFKNKDYYNFDFQTRHSAICDRACFNPDHLDFGSQSDNEKDKILAGKNKNLNKDNCPRCGKRYTTLTNKTGSNKGKKFRLCYNCKNLARRVKNGKKINKLQPLYKIREKI